MFHSGSHTSTVTEPGECNYIPPSKATGYPAINGQVSEASLEVRRVPGEIIFKGRL